LNFDHTFTSFVALYPQLCFTRFKGVLPPGYGTIAHKEEMWEWIWSDKIVSGINTAFESSRWKNWSEKWEFWETSVDVILFVAVYILLTRGNVKTIDDISFLKSLVGDRLAEHGIDAPDGAVEVDLKALKEAAQARIRVAAT
jgi:hypothetical protein